MPLRQFTRAELLVTQRMQLEWPLLLMVLLGSGAFALAEGNGFYLGLTTLGVVVNALALLRRSEFYVPRLAVNLAVLAVSLYFVFDFWNGQIVASLGHFLILIQLCKLFEQKRNGDYAQIILLSVVSIIGGAMITSGMWFAVLLLVYVPVCFYVTMVLSLKIALDRQVAARLAVESAPADPERVAWNISPHLPRGLLWRWAGLLTLASMLLTAVIFLLMPRIPQGLLVGLRGSGSGAGSTGLSETLRLNDVRRIKPDRKVVMRVSMADGEGKDLGPEGYQAYFRGRTYYDYILTTHEWQPATTDSVVSQELAQSVLCPTGENLVVQRVTMDPSLLPMLPRIDPMLEVTLPNGVGAISSYPDLDADNRADPTTAMQYRAVSLRRPFTLGQQQHFANHARQAPRRFAANDSGVPQRVGQLAHQWCDDLLNERFNAMTQPAKRNQIDRAIAQRICQRLQQECGYTLDLSEYDAFGADPVEQFLFKVKRGHCELFASAMVLMCQELGVKARMAGGFVVSEYSRLAGGYLVRNSDAHAWCEVYSPTDDWVIYDPTPGGWNQTGGTLSGVSDSLDYVKFFWSTRVMSYNESDRQRLFGGLLSRFEQAWRGALEFFKQAFRSLWNLFTKGEIDKNIVKGVTAVGLLLGLAAMIALGVKLIQRRRKRRLARPGRQTPDWYRRLHRLLEKHGHWQHDSQTPAEYLRQAGQTFALPEPAVARLTELLYQARWGGDPSSADSPEAGQLAESLRRQIKAKR